MYGEIGLLTANDPPMSRLVSFCSNLPPLVLTPWYAEDLLVIEHASFQ